MQLFQSGVIYLSDSFGRHCEGGLCSSQGSYSFGPQIHLEILAVWTKCVFQHK